MRIEIINSIESLSFYKESWESILKEINNDIIFLELDWIMRWWKFFGDKHKLFVLVVFKDQEVAGICPLMITKKSGCDEIGFIGGRESSSMDFILRDKYREEAVGCICNFLRGIKGKNIIKLHGISERTLNYILIRKYLKANKVPFISANLVCYLLNTKNDDFYNYFIKRFSKETRSGISKREKRLKRLGNLVFKRISSSEIDEIFEVHEKRWLRKIGNGSFSKGDTREFYKELALNNNMRFNVIINAMVLNSKIISFTYVIKYKEKIFCVRIAHDDDFYFLSPGELILIRKVEESFLLKEGILDFGPGYESYKARWTDDFEKLFTILIPASNLQSLVNYYIKYWTKAKLTSALKKNKMIYDFRKYSLARLKFLLSKEHISNEFLRIKRAIEQHGLTVFVKKNLIYLAGKIFSHKKYLVLERELRSLEIPKGDLYVKEATIDDLDELSEVMNEAASKIVRRFTNKCKCYTTAYNGEIIFYCWVSYAKIKISGTDLPIPFGSLDAHIYETFIKKKYKNGYNYTYILLSILNLLYKEKYRRCYITLDGGNKSIENCIYKKMFHARYEIIEKRAFGTTRHKTIDIKLNDKGKRNA